MLDAVATWVDLGASGKERHNCRLVMEGHVRLNDDSGAKTCRSNGILLFSDPTSNAYSIGHLHRKNRDAY